MYKNWIQSCTDCQDEIQNNTEAYLVSSIIYRIRHIFLGVLPLIINLGNLSDRYTLADVFQTKKLSNHIHNGITKLCMEAVHCLEMLKKKVHVESYRRMFLVKLTFMEHIHILNHLTQTSETTQATTKKILSRKACPTNKLLF